MSTVSEILPIGTSPIRQNGMITNQIVVCGVESDAKSAEKPKCFLEESPILARVVGWVINWRMCDFAQTPTIRFLAIRPSERIRQ